MSNKKGQKKLNILNAQQFQFVQHYKGDAKAAMTAAGYKWSREGQYRLLSKKHIREALMAKQEAANKEAGKKIGRAVTVTRNDIINRLDAISRTAESDNARVSALRELKDIFGLSAKNTDETDLFAGWTEEELEYYRSTGELPPSRGQAMGTSESDSGDPEASET
jgi:hypothetical protein